MNHKLGVFKGTFSTDAPRLHARITLGGKPKWWQKLLAYGYPLFLFLLGWICLTTFMVLVSGCKYQFKDLEQAYSEGYRVGWSHGVNGHPAQLGNNKKFQFVAVGKECLYEDEEWLMNYDLKIFRDDRCES